MSAFAAAEAPSGGRRRPRTRPEVVLRRAILTVVMSGVVIAFLSPLAYSGLTSLKTEAPDLRRRTRRSCRPTRRRSSARARPTTSTTCRCPTARRASSRSSTRAGRTRDFIDPANPTGGEITLAGLVAHARPAVADRPALRELRRGLDSDRLPAPALQHARPRRDRATIGTVLSCTLVAYGFARFRFPGRGAAVHAAAGDDLPAGGRHADPDVRACS